MSDLRDRYDFLFDGDGELTQETLLLYVFGPLENGARDAVEQHLDECEMCRDAAEGMALLGTKEQALGALALADARLLERVELLKQKVTSSGREALITQAAAEPILLPEKSKHRIGWYRYAAAASIILLLGAGFWFVNQAIHQKDAYTVAMNKEDSLGLFRNESEPTETQNEINPVTNKMDSAQSDLANTDLSMDTVAFGYVSSASAPSISSTFKMEDVNVGVSKPVEEEAKKIAVDEVSEANELDLADIVALEEVSANDKNKSQRKGQKNNADVPTSAGVVAPRAPAPSASKGSYENSNTHMNNVANMDIALEQAQYPGGNAAVQQYFDTVTYPATIAKGYKGVIVFEVSFDKKGAIKNATITSGLGEPYDKLLLDHLKKMPKWDAPQPNGQPIESVRPVMVEVTVK